MAVEKWLLKADSSFYERGVQDLVQWWGKFVQGGGEYVKK
jgi:hypothetical protein